MMMLPLLLVVTLVISTDAQLRRRDKPGGMMGRGMGQGNKRAPEPKLSTQICLSDMPIAAMALVDTINTIVHNNERPEMTLSQINQCVQRVMMGPDMPMGRSPWGPPSRPMPLGGRPFPGGRPMAGGTEVMKLKQMVNQLLKEKMQSNLIVW